MPRPRRFIPPEYKAEVVELIRTGKTVGQGDRSPVSCYRLIEAEQPYHAVS